MLSYIIEYNSWIGFHKFDSFSDNLFWDIEDVSYFSHISVVVPLFPEPFGWEQQFIGKDVGIVV